MILLVLEKSVDGYVVFEDFIYNPLLERPVKKSALALALKRLRMNGLVELLSDQELAYRLTDSGKDKALWKRMMFEDEPWDGKWRVVIWDIPEKRRMARDLLRYKLKQLGFSQLQKSIWGDKEELHKSFREFYRSSRN